MRPALPLLACLLVALACLSLSLVGNADLWWSLASGEEILDRGAVPERDPFLFTSADRDTWVSTSREQPTWVRHSWLFTVVLAAVHRALGVEGLALLQLLATAGFATLVFTHARLDRHGLVNALLTTLVLIVAVDRLALRAEMTGWLLFAVYVTLLERDAPMRGRTVALLALLQWLWSNLHGSHPLGFALAAAYSLGALVEGRRERAPLWLAPLLAAVSVATPGLGGQRVLDALATLQQLVAGTTGGYETPIDEWVGTYVAGPATRWARLHLGIAAVGAASFAAARRLRLARLLVFVGMGALGVTAVRFVSGFAIATALVAMANLAELRTGLAERAAALGARTRTPQRILAALLGAGLVAGGAVHFALRDALEVGQSRDSLVTLHPLFTAPGAARYVRDARLEGPIFNDLALGGFLIHALHPEHQLFIDSRNLSAKLLSDYAEATVRAERWRELEARYGFGVAILGNPRLEDFPLRVELARDASWQVAYVDPQATVFVKRRRASPPAPRFAVRGGADGVPYLSSTAARLPGLPDRGAPLLVNYLNALFDLGRAGDARDLASEALALHPDDLLFLQSRALGRLRTGRPKLAAEDYARVIARTPRNANAHFRLAVALHAAGDLQGARAALAELVRLQPGHPGIPMLERRLGPG